MQEKTLKKGNFPELGDCFGNRLELLLTGGGLTQSELARLMGTRQSTIQGWLTGAIPRSRTLTELATLFNVSEEWLKFGKGEKHVSGETSKIQEDGEKEEMLEFSDRKYRDLIVEFIDDLPPRMLVETIEALGRRMTGGDRSAVEKAGAVLDLIHERRPEVFEDGHAYELDYYGYVAAGLPADVDYFSGETRKVPHEYGPKKHFLLRVRGESMAPNFPDGSYVVVRSLLPGEYPRKGDVVIANDGDGPCMKLLEYRKTGPKTDIPRKPTPHLVSINPEYPEIVPMNVDTPVQGIVVDSYEADFLER